MIETIEHRSPRIAVVVHQYIFIDIQTIFVPDLIESHKALLKPGTSSAVVGLKLLSA